MLHRAFAVVAISFAFSSCAEKSRTPSESPTQSSMAPGGAEDESEQNPSKTRLPASVKVVSDTAENFGIDLSRLSPAHASVVASAWKTYSQVLDGAEPKCSVAFAVSDGGTVGYFCEGYDITRVHGLSSKNGVDGYEYGPMLDLLNGQKVERIKFYSEKELAALTQAAP